MPPVASCDFYPRPPRGGRRELRFALPSYWYFYPRPPRGGRRSQVRRHSHCIKFLSTPSARRATTFPQAFNTADTNFYPRPPRGGRPWLLRCRQRSSSYFYPRPPRGGRRELRFALPSYWYFYPRPPRGGRRSQVRRHSHCIKFLSTPSARRATTFPQAFNTADTNFYPRPPRGGRPWLLRCRQRSSSYFYPRPPRGGRLQHPHTKDRPHLISIHALREEGDFAMLGHME